MPPADTYQCPFCGAEATVGQPCSGCAPKLARKAKRRPPPGPKPWQQDEIYDTLDLPDEDFDYDEYAAREFGRVPHRRLGVKWYWWVLAGIAVVAILAWALDLPWRLAGG